MDKLVSLEEAAEILGICERNVWGRTFPRGPIKCVRIGRRVLYSVVWLTEWMQAGCPAVGPAETAQEGE